MNNVKQEQSGVSDEYLPITWIKEAERSPALTGSGSEPQSQQETIPFLCHFFIFCVCFVWNCDHRDCKCRACLGSGYVLHNVVN